MTKRAAFVLLFGILSAGCQAVLPIHQGEGALDGSIKSEEASLKADSPSGDDDANFDTDAGCPQATFTGAVCDDCLTVHCCAALNQCLVIDADCKAIVDCMTACSSFDVSCLESCPYDHPKGEDDYTKLLACEKTACPSPTCL